MLSLHLNGTDRTIDLEENSLSLKNQIQRRSDDLSFTLIDGLKPSENQEAKLYAGDTIAGFSGTTVTLRGYFQRGVSFFYAGQKLKIRYGDADEEEVEVLSFDEEALEIELVEAPSGTVTAGDKIGQLLFGGVVSAVETKNIVYKTNVVYEVSCVSSDKIFDKQLVADTWTDKDARQIINSFLNTTVNYNRELDDMEYSDTPAIRAEWIESSDGSNPSIEDVDFIEGEKSAHFHWVHSVGTAIFTRTIPALDLSVFSGSNTGLAIQGNFTAWVKLEDHAAVTSLKLRLKDGTNTMSFTLSKGSGKLKLQASNEWQFLSVPLAFFSITTGATFDWQAVTGIVVEFVETGSSACLVDDLRITAKGSFTMFNVQQPPSAFTDFRSPYLKPTALVDLMAKTFEFTWYIDGDRDIHYMPKDTELAPWNVLDSGADVFGLTCSVDQSMLGNRILVVGGEETSESFYSQVFQGNSIAREWVLKAKFKNLTILIDDGTSTHSAEVGTTTTNVKITGHGLTTGDHVTNRTRSVVREVTVVDANNFTVEAVTGQTNGDNITFYSDEPTLGIEGITDESTVDYLYNSNEKTVRASQDTATLTSSSYLRVSYNERVPIQLQYTDWASVNRLKALGLGNGIFDLDPYSDQNIEDRQTAIAVAQAKVNDFANPVINGSYTTDRRGIKAGQLQAVIDSNQGINDDYVIQAVSLKQKGGQYHDNLVSSVTFGTTLFGWIEFMQKLLSGQEKIEVNDDAIVATFASNEETAESSDANATATDGGFLTATESEVATTSDSNQAIDWPSGTWQFEPSTGQTLPTRFDLCDFG